MADEDVMTEQVVDDAARSAVLFDQAARCGFLLVPGDRKPELLERIRQAWGTYVDDKRESVAEKEGEGMAEPKAPPEVMERMDKLPAGGLLLAAEAMGEGMKYEDDGYAHWETRAPDYHLNRALIHIRLWQAGDRSEAHVGHAISRLLMWGDMVE